MRYAVFHHFMDNIGGAEVVSLTFAREFGADIYTTNMDADKIRKMGFADVLPRIRSIGRIPIRAPFRQQLAFWKFRRLNLGRQYDFYIISGDWAMSGAVNNAPNLWYIHSPINELWQFKDMIRDEMITPWKRPIFDAWVWFNRKLTLSYARRVERWVCNSTNTKKRVERFYRVSPEVIYPPITIDSLPPENPGNYWLSVNRLFDHKRIEIQLEAFAKLPDEKLIIVGSYEKGAAQFESYKKRLEDMKTPNVTIIHWVDNDALKKLYAGCIGFITTSKDEDFGMTAVEAMAAGKYVIAPNEGGYRESVISGKTGALIDNISSEKLAAEIRRMSPVLKSNPETYRGNSIAQASLFSTERCMEKLRIAIAQPPIS